MNEKPDPRARLVADTYHDDWESGTAGAFARAAAAHARRRRTLRRGAIATATLAAVLVASLKLADRDVAAGARLAEEPALHAPSSKVSPAFEIISDEELHAELRTRPLLILPDQPAERRYVVLSR